MKAGTRVIKRKDLERFSSKMESGLGISGMISPTGMVSGKDLMGKGSKGYGRMGAMCKQFDLTHIAVIYIHFFVTYFFYMFKKS
jgi:hypothetical protein